MESAKVWITSQKSRLRDLIQEELDFKKDEIELDTQEDIELAKEKRQKADDLIKAKEAEGKKPTQAQLNNLQKAKEALEKLIKQKEQRIADAEEQAEKERIAIDEVETELLTMLADPELRKRYFSVVDMEELEENEFNLNIPRYVDTFEPEEEIDLQEAVAAYKKTLLAENSIDELLSKLMEVVQ